MSARENLYLFAMIGKLQEDGNRQMAWRKLDDHHAEVVAERDAEILRWLSKKAREYRATGRKTDRERADLITALASKISRGAVRPNNTLLPAGVEPTFFEPGRTYQREHHGQPITFIVRAVSTSPDGRCTVAHGWRTDPYSGWEPFDSDDLTGWTDVTTVYPVGGENAQEGTR